jgi:hypothetical protein
VRIASVANRVAKASVVPVLLLRFVSVRVCFRHSAVQSQLPHCAIIVPNLAANQRSTPMIGRLFTHALLGLALACLAACKDAARHQEVSGSRSAAAGATACDGLSIPVESTPPDSISEADRCHLVRRAIASLGQAVASSGVERADTAAVVRAVISPLSEETAQGAPIRSTWHISLWLKGKPYDAEVVLDRATGGMEVRRSHKPLGAPSSGD